MQNWVINSGKDSLQWSYKGSSPSLQDTVKKGVSSEGVKKRKSQFKYNHLDQLCSWENITSPFYGVIISKYHEINNKFKWISLMIQKIKNIFCLLCGLEDSLESQKGVFKTFCKKDYHS